MSDKVRQKKEKILLQARIVHTPEYRYRYLLLVGTVCVGKKFLLTLPFLKIPYGVHVAVGIGFTFSYFRHCLLAVWYLCTVSLVHNFPIFSFSHVVETARSRSYRMYLREMQPGSDRRILVGSSRD